MFKSLEDGFIFSKIYFKDLFSFYCNFEIFVFLLIFMVNILKSYFES